MQVIRVCIGSACHLKGSYHVIQQLKHLIRTHNLQDQVELVSSFCLEKCGDGVSIQVNSNDVAFVNPEDTANFFNAFVLMRCAP